MNLCTRSLHKAAWAAQGLANIRGVNVAIFKTATDPNGPYWTDSMPSWWAGRGEQAWCEHMVRYNNARIYYPNKKNK